MQRLQLSLVFAITWLLFASILHIIPGSALPSENWLTKIRIDKWVHTGMFFILVVTWFIALKNSYPQSEARRILVKVILACIVYGLIMECVQRFYIPNRSFDVWDIAADAAGCLAAYFFCSGRYIKK